MCTCTLEAEIEVLIPTCSLYFALEVHCKWLTLTLTPTLVEACKHTKLNSEKRVRVRGLILCSVVSHF